MSTTAPRRGVTVSGIRWTRSFPTATDWALSDDSLTIFDGDDIVAEFVRGEIVAVAFADAWEVGA